MTALSLPRLVPLAPPQPEPPVALLHLPVGSPRAVRDAATAVYRQARQGRRVIAVSSGPADQLIHALDRIGVPAVSSQPHGPELVVEPVVVIEGAAVAAPAPAPLATPTPVRVALAGCGVVGGGLYARLRDDPRFEISAVLVRNPRLRRDPQPDPARQVISLDALLATSPDIVIDVLSDAEAGRLLTRLALARGVHVVSANKQAIGPELDQLQALAARTGATLALSACVGGGGPLIETLQRALDHAPVVRIEAVLNGTVNFLLNRLSAGAAFADALSEAQTAGFAEADPSADLEGRDAAAKLSILSDLAFGCRKSALSVQKLCAETALPAGPVRQVARTDVHTATISFEPVAHDPLLADLPDEWNAIRVTCEDGRVFTARGRGAGRWPTAESVWSGLLDIVEAPHG